VAVVLLAVQLIIQVFQMQKGTRPARWRTWLNWLLIILVIVGFGGAHFVSNDATVSAPTNKSVATKKAKTTKHVKKAKATKKETREQPLKSASFKSTVQLGKDNTTHVIFTIPADAQLQLVRDDNKQVLAAVNNPSKDSRTQFSYLFGTAGVYDVVTMRGNKKIEKKLTVNKQGTTNSSSSSSQQSQSSKGKSSSSSATSNSTANSDSNSGDQGYHIEYRRRLVWVNQ
jgi:uncharacterized protein with GYD domain